MFHCVNVVKMWKCSLAMRCMITHSETFDVFVCLASMSQCYLTGRLWSTSRYV